MPWPPSRTDIERLTGRCRAGANAKASAPAAETVADEIYDFLMERLRAYYLERGGACRVAGGHPEMFDAVLAARPASPLDFDARLKR